MMTSCNNLNSHDNGSSYLLFDNADNNYYTVLPYTETFENSIKASVQDCNPGFKWQINIDNNGNSFLECTYYDKNEIIEGMPIFDLLIGDVSWENYLFSFDFKLTDDAYITFAPYADTNMDTNTNYDYFDSRNYWSLEINSKGELIYNTVFEQGSHYIVQSPNVINGFDANEWNNIELIPKGTDLLMKMNGYDVGIVAELQENNAGRISIGGGVGCMFDNLVISNDPLPDGELPLMVGIRYGYGADIPAADLPEALNTAVYLGKIDLDGTDNLISESWAEGTDVYSANGGIIVMGNEKNPAAYLYPIDGEAADIDPERNVTVYYTYDSDLTQEELDEAMKNAVYIGETKLYYSESNLPDKSFSSNFLQKGTKLYQYKDGIIAEAKFINKDYAHPYPAIFLKADTEENP